MKVGKDISGGTGPEQLGGRSCTDLELVREAIRLLDPEERACVLTIVEPEFRRILDFSAAKDKYLRRKVYKKLNEILSRHRGK